MSNLGKKRITQEQRDQIVRRKLAGEKTIALAAEFGVSSAYVNMLKIQAIDPTRYEKTARVQLKKLTDAELVELGQILATTTPADHGLTSPSQPNNWLNEHGQLLAEKLFQKRPSVRVVHEFMAPHLTKKKPYEFTRPTPPLPRHLDQIPPELAKDPSYVAYYMSAIGEQVAWRSYECAVKDYDERFAGKEERHSAAESPDVPDFPSPPQRQIGKHAQKKGSPFTPAKKKRR